MIKGFATQDRAKMWRDKYICMEDRFSDVLFSDPFRKKRSDHESQKSGFRFDLKNPLEVWILWIHNPFLDLVIKRKIRFRIQESVFLPKKTHPKLQERMAGNLRCFLLSSVLPGGGGGGGVLPSNRLMGMCRWMGSPFHDWIDYNEVAFSIELLYGVAYFRDLGGGGRGEIHLLPHFPWCISQLAAALAASTDLVQWHLKLYQQLVELFGCNNGLSLKNFLENQFEVENVLDYNGTP